MPIILIIGWRSEGSNPESHGAERTSASVTSVTASKPLSLPINSTTSLSLFTPFISSSVILNRIVRLSKLQLSLSSSLIMSRFAYLPLDTARHEIRLFRLLPAPFVDDQIHVQIFHETLSDEHVPEFEAISYVWGSTRNCPSIIVSPMSKPSARNIVQLNAQLLRTQLD